MYTREIDDLRAAMRIGFDPSDPYDVEAMADLIMRITELGEDPWADDVPEPDPDDLFEAIDDGEAFH